LQRGHDSSHSAGPGSPSPGNLIRGEPIRNDETRQGEKKTLPRLMISAHVFKTRP
jgi:hypothetical protein